MLEHDQSYPRPHCHVVAEQGVQLSPGFSPELFAKALGFLLLCKKMCTIYECLLCLPYCPFYLLALLTA